MSHMQHGEHSLSGARCHKDKGLIREKYCFSFDFDHIYRKYSRRLPRQMTVSGDSGHSSRHYRSVTKLFGRALSRTLTLNSMDGSNSTILLEDWRFHYIYIIHLYGKVF